MKKSKLFILATLLVFAGTNVVSANMFSLSTGKYLVDQHVEIGWNIFNCFLPNSIQPGSEVVQNDLKVIWAYAPQFKKYYQLFPKNELDNVSVEIGRQIDEDQILSSACWVYSTKNGNIKYDTLGTVLPLKDRKLYSGWNFISLTPEFKVKKIKEWKGSCNIEKYAIYQESGWKLISPQILAASTHPDVQGLAWDDVMVADSNSDIGRGIIIYVSNDCNMEQLSEVNQPPQIPNF